MKKKTAGMILALSVVCIAAFGGCGGGGVSASDAGMQTPGRVLLSGFSDFRELRTFKFSGYFDKAEVNEDEAYITEGTASAKLTVDGGLGGIPEFSIYTDTKYNTKSDWTDVQAISVDVFNADETARSMWVSFMTRESGATRAEYLEKEYSLKPGYNLITYVIDREVANRICYLDKVEYVNFRFENGHDDPYILYMDNLQAHLTEEPIGEMEKAYEEGELLFFDDPVDRYFASATTIRAMATEAATLSMCRDPRYIKSGTGSLQATVVVDPAGLATHSPAVTISGEPVTRVDFSLYSKVQFSVMTDADLPANNMMVEFFDVNGVFLNAIDDIRAQIGWGTMIEAGKWYTLEVDIQTLVDAGLDVTKIDRINFYYQHVMSGEPFSWYFDEFTLVK